MELFFGVICGLLILMLLVAAHEAGHAIMALRNGVVVEEFGIGFPPKMFAKKLKNGINFSLNLLPLGGFVKLQGEHDAACEKGDYGSVSFWKKTKILFGGVFVNWLLAAVILTFLSLVGLPKVLPNQFAMSSDMATVKQPVEIASVTNGYPADVAGLKVGDKIVRFANQEIPTPDILIKLSKQNMGKDVSVIYNRDGVEHSVNVKLRNKDSGGVFGVGLGQRELVRSTWSAPLVGAVTTTQFTIATLQGVGSLFSSLVDGIISQFSSVSSVRDKASAELQEVGDNVAGPIGIIGTIFPQAQQAGPTQLLLLTAIISISLAVMNVLPIPSLDGGRWFTTLVFRLSKKKLTREREEKIQMIGFSTLMGLVILVTIADVAKLF